LSVLIVPDASVLLKWVLPAENEQHASQALAIRDALIDGKVSLLAPELWYYEVGNVLARNYPEQADAMLGCLAAMEIENADPEPVWQSVMIKLVSSYHVTFYDAAYHGLAVVRDGMFVTADEKYIHKASAAGHVISLQAWRDILP